MKEEEDGDETEEETMNPLAPEENNDSPCFKAQV